MELIIESAHNAHLLGGGCACGIAITGYVIRITMMMILEITRI